MPAALPVHLITGLLGSGKTTCISQLIKQQPAHENWAILINEFGEVDIDSHLLTSQQNKNLSIHPIAGGCICCTAQIALTRAVNELLKNQPNLDRIFIEPTGLGHPAKVIDSLQTDHFVRPLSLQKVVCIISPQQLTKQRWNKSAVMRDLVHLADIIVLNKIDTSTQQALAESNQILNKCYPPKEEVIQADYAKVELAQLTSRRPDKQFTILNTSPSTLHQQQTDQCQLNCPSTLPGTEHCYASQNAKQVLSIGWIWDSNVQFNRTQLKQFFSEFNRHLVRAKGILKTGNEWQLLQWSDNQLSLEDMAWRQDSRLELIFKELDENENPAVCSIEQIEQQLNETIHSFANKAID